MEKSPEAFRTISEVAEWLGTPTHVLRFWESRFTQVKPVKRAGGRRYYRPSDMELLGGIKKLVHEEGMTIRSVQQMLREEGVRHVAAFSQPLEFEASEHQDHAPEAPMVTDVEAPERDSGTVVQFDPSAAPLDDAAAQVEFTFDSPSPAPEPKAVPDRLALLRELYDRLIALRDRMDAADAKSQEG